MQPTEITAIQTGSRATNETLTPGQLSNPIISLQQPASLPDPVGTAAILSAIQNGNIFRDMSGLQATIGLAQSATQGTQAGAAIAGQQAGENMNNLLKANTERQRIAADMIKSLASTAASVYGIGKGGGGGSGGGGTGGGGGGNTSQDGAKINYFDRTATAKGGTPSQSSGASNPSTASPPVATPGGSTTSGTRGGNGGGVSPTPPSTESDASAGPVWSQNPAALAATWGDGAPPSSLFQTVVGKVPAATDSSNASAMGTQYPDLYFSPPFLNLGTGHSKSVVHPNTELGINKNGSFFLNFVDISSYNRVPGMPKHDKFRFVQRSQDQAWQKVNGAWSHIYDQGDTADNPLDGNMYYDKTRSVIFMYDSSGLLGAPGSKTLSVSAGHQSDENATEIVSKILLTCHVEGAYNFVGPDPPPDNLTDWQRVPDDLQWVSVQWLKRNSPMANWVSQAQQGKTNVVTGSDALVEYVKAPDAA